MPVKQKPRPPVLFAHQSEAEIARLLDFYGVHWEYEPRSFPLEWDAEGRPTSAFSPDFYLPDYDLYLEITTIRPSLINRKNRKIRRLRELYPDVMIKLLTLKDMEALLQKYGWGRREETQANRMGEKSETEKNLSEERCPADRTENRSIPLAAPSASTDLSTHQGRRKYTKR
jgi:bifunctional protein TilS/HprT